MSDRSTWSRRTAADRLTALDVSFLYRENRETPTHVGELLVLRPGPTGSTGPAGTTGAIAGLDYDRLVRLVQGRLGLVPRYRQRVRTVPGNLAAPVWVDDPTFDIGFHVRRSALPRPGSLAQLVEFTARIMSRPVDRSRPLWEMYLIEGLAPDGDDTDPGLHGPPRRDRVAVLTKTHQALVDGVSAIDIGTVILDARPDAADPPGERWIPEPEPGDLGLVVGAVAEIVRRPTRAVDVVRADLSDLRSGAWRVTGAARAVVSAARSAARPPTRSPLHVEVGTQRRFAVARTPLADYREVRAARGGTVNDVVLAVVSGALRAWLMFRGEAVHPGSTVRALVPVSVRDEDTAAHDAIGSGGAGGFGGGVSSYIVDLPVGEPNPFVRLSQVGYAMRAHAESGRSVDAESIATLGGFAPPTLHALGARAAQGIAERQFTLVVANVPGPQFPLYAGGAVLEAMYPVLPLRRGHAVAIGLTSYDGRVCFGINADRDAVPDVDLLATLVEEALAELVGAVRAATALPGAPDPPGPADRPQPVDTKPDTGPDTGRDTGPDTGPNGAPRPLRAVASRGRARREASGPFGGPDT